MRSDRNRQTGYRGDPREETMNVKDATKDDIPELCGLLDCLFTQETEFHPDRMLQTAGLGEIIGFPDRGRILTIRSEPGIVGMVSLLFTVSTALGGQVALLEDMIVHPDHRRRGAGTALIGAALTLARSLGCRRITLLTDGCNESAISFYQHHGFVVSDMIPMRLPLFR
jgi:GNAT superfamily N-acetyltransferase